MKYEIYRNRRKVILADSNGNFASTDIDNNGFWVHPTPLLLEPNGSRRKLWLDEEELYQPLIGRITTELKSYLRGRVIAKMDGASIYVVMPDEPDNLSSALYFELYLKNLLEDGEDFLLGKTVSNHRVNFDDVFIKVNEVDDSSWNNLFPMVLGKFPDPNHISARLALNTGYPITCNGESLLDSPLLYANTIFGESFQITFTDVVNQGGANFHVFITFSVYEPEPGYLRELSCTLFPVCTSLYSSEPTGYYRFPSESGSVQLEGFYRDRLRPGLLHLVDEVKRYPGGFALREHEIAAKFNYSLEGGIGGFQFVPKGYPIPIHHNSVSNSTYRSPESESMNYTQIIKMVPSIPLVGNTPPPKYYWDKRVLILDDETPEGVVTFYPGVVDSSITLTRSGSFHFSNQSSTIPKLSLINPSKSSFNLTKEDGKVAITFSANVESMVKTNNYKETFEIRCEDDDHTRQMEVYYLPRQRRKEATILEAQFPHRKGFTTPRALVEGCRYNLLTILPVAVSSVSVSAKDPFLVASVADATKKDAKEPFVIELSINDNLNIIEPIYTYLVINNVYKVYITIYPLHPIINLEKAGVEFLHFEKDNVVPYALEEGYSLVPRYPELDWVTYADNQFTNVGGSKHYQVFDVVRSGSEETVKQIFISENYGFPYANEFIYTTTRTIPFVRNTTPNFSFLIKLARPFYNHKSILTTEVLSPSDSTMSIKHGENSIKFRRNGVIYDYENNLNFEGERKLIIMNPNPALFELENSELIVNKDNWFEFYEIKFRSLLPSTNHTEYYENLWCYFEDKPDELIPIFLEMSVITSSPYRGFMRTRSPFAANYTWFNMAIKHPKTKIRVRGFRISGCLVNFRITNTYINAAENYDDVEYEFVHRTLADAYFQLPAFGYNAFYDRAPSPNVATCDVEAYVLGIDGRVFAFRFFGEKPFEISKHIGKFPKEINISISDKVFFTLSLSEFKTVSLPSLPKDSGSILFQKLDSAIVEYILDTPLEYDIEDVLTNDGLGNDLFFVSSEVRGQSADWLNFKDWCEEGMIGYRPFSLIPLIDYNCIVSESTSTNHYIESSNVLKYVNSHNAYERKTGSADYLYDFNYGSNSWTKQTGSAEADASPKQQLPLINDEGGVFYRQPDETNYKDIVFKQEESDKEVKVKHYYKLFYNLEVYDVGYE